MITPSFSPTATERVLPKLALDFTTGTLDNRVTFTRSSVGTYLDASGVLQTANNNIPRFDYDYPAGTCKGLLIEESRSNTISSWSYFNSVTSSAIITDNAATGPDNTNTARSVQVAVGQTSGGFRSLYQYNVPLQVGHSFSIFVKNVNATSALLQISDNGASGAAYVSLDFSTNQITFFKSASWGGSGSMQVLGNNWYRIMFSFTIPSNGSTTCVPLFTVTGAAGTSALVWGAQLELNGAFPTSFIPWGSSPRAADVATMTGTNFSSWFNASEGTFSGQSTGASLNSQYPCIVSACSSSGFGDTYNTITLCYNYGNSNSTIFEVGNGTQQASIVRSITDKSATNKIVGAYKVNNFATSANASAVGTDVSGTLPTVDVLRIGAGYTQPSSNTFCLNAYVQKIMYWPQRLTNAEVQAFSK